MTSTVPSAHIASAQADSGLAGLPSASSAYPLASSSAQMTARPSQLDWPERLESLKAGAVGAVALGGLSLGVSGINAQMANRVPQLAGWGERAAQDPGVCLVELSVAVISGLLFGITYRYIIRGDRNAHLQAGAVGAFGLVRGLALVEGAVGAAQPNWLGLGLGVIESLLLFLAVRSVLDGAIALGWLTRFTQEFQPNE
jgi:hypothetical protein